MSDLFENLSPDARSRLRPSDPPRWVDPMLATLTHETFSDPAWVYERKLDGVRALVFRSGAEVRLMSRNRKSMAATYPELVDAVRAEARSSFVADGEIVAFEGSRTSFSRLQGRIGIEDPDAARATGIAVYLYLFDLVWVDGRDLRRLRLRDRKTLLRRALAFRGRVRFTPHRNGDGEAFHEEACAKGWEGVLAKDAASTYEGKRSRAWLKMKCGHRQELVIGGYTDPKGSRRGFGALLVGYYDDGADGGMRYAGKVGTGYDDDTLERLGARLRGLRRDRSPFADPVRVDGAHFVAPELVGEVGFTEWTGDGKLRHPRFLGIRPDKEPTAVRRESPDRGAG